MIKVHFPLIITLALAVGACAQTPLKNSQTLAAEATHFGVSQDLLLRASSAGYSPTTRHHQTYFCTDQTQTFSYVPRRMCLDPTQMTAYLHDSAAGVRAIHRAVISVPMSHAPAPGSGG